MSTKTKTSTKKPTKLAQVLYETHEKNLYGDSEAIPWANLTGLTRSTWIKVAEKAQEILSLKL